MTNKPKILLADDARDRLDHYIDLVQQTRPDLEPHTVQTVTDARLIIAEMIFSGGIIDYDFYDVPGGPRIIKELRRAEAARGDYRSRVTLATGFGREKFDQCKAEALAAGANDAISLHYTSEGYWEQLRNFLETIVVAPG